MTQRQASYLELKGDSYTIGQQLGGIISQWPLFKEYHTSGRNQTPSRAAEECRQLFERYCPGLNEELRGLADRLEVQPQQLPFYLISFLAPRCSQMVLLPPKTRDAHVLMARSYEFSDTMEDFILARTAVKGKYAHLGTTVALMGRDEGLNECGLGVTMSSCGLPVGALPEMRNPALKSLQYWALIRALLENCRDVEEGLAYLRDTPLAYNINLLLADRSGHAALYETLDGRQAFRTIGPDSPECFLLATNHAVLPEFKALEPLAMRNSRVRFQQIKRFLSEGAGINREHLKQLLLERYPAGLFFPYHADFMGTTKSLLLDISAGALEICWAGLHSNGWQIRDISREYGNSFQTIDLYSERAQPEIFEMVAD